MASYPTSSYKKIKGKYRRYVVTYDNEEMTVMTFGIAAHSESEATGLTIAFINKNNLHTSEIPYYLTVQLSQEKTDYYIPYKTNPEL